MNRRTSMARNNKPRKLTISAKWLKSASNQIEQDAKDALHAWVLLGVAQKYLDKMELVRVMRKAAGIKSIAERRTFLRMNGVDV